MLTRYWQFTDATGRKHVRSENLQAWLFHRGFATLESRNAAIRAMHDDELRFVWGAIEYVVTQIRFGAKVEYDVRAINLVS